MKTYFDEKTRLKNIIKDKRFNGYGNKLNIMPGVVGNIFGTLTIKRITTMIPTWKYADIPYGLNAAASHVDAGVDLHYDIYTKEEIRRSPSKNDTGLFHFPAKKNAPFVLIMAGGAYTGVATIVEAFPIAAALNELGINAFVLNYRCGKKNLWPTPSEDLHRAVQFILENAADFEVQKDNYAIMGFSAGGHLAASFGTDNYGYTKMDLPMPSALILSYPVICFDEMTSVMQNCKNNMIGRQAGEKAIGEINIIKHMNEKYPSTYIWHCKDDEQVPFTANAKAFADKAKQLGIRCQLKAVNHGGHGMGLASGSEAEGWVKEAVEFWLDEK